MDAEPSDRWFSVRVLFELVFGDETASGSHNRFEDRLILVRAKNEEEALAKGARFAEGTEEQYLSADGQTTGWTFSHVIEAHEILDSTLQDGTEIYSAFVDQDTAEVLMCGADSPVKAWLRQHPGADPARATVQELVEA
jgi:hypothetical protein